MDIIKNKSAEFLPPTNELAVSKERIPLVFFNKVVIINHVN